MLKIPITTFLLKQYYNLKSILCNNINHWRRVAKCKLTLQKISINILIIRVGISGTSPVQFNMRLRTTVYQNVFIK